jgi:hypothetical protein
VLLLLNKLKQLAQKLPVQNATQRTLREQNSAVTVEKN